MICWITPRSKSYCLQLDDVRVTLNLTTDVAHIQSTAIVEAQREKIYHCLEEYCKQQNPSQSQRFAKLLLRLPALRSLSIKCNETNDLIIAAPQLEELRRIIVERQSRAQMDVML
ncbi:hypothetical protein AB6A40_008196 [Gnathostoma spinigerum]|uniref:NR LBD domain-containing protein n=1 Tax=Gnathostoma spinigerum TaxID=75299 RepID=A0ABD6EY05_9BILA